MNYEKEVGVNFAELISCSQQQLNSPRDARGALQNGPQSSLCLKDRSTGHLSTGSVPHWLRFEEWGVSPLCSKCVHLSESLIPASAQEIGVQRDSSCCPGKVLSGQA